MLFISLKHLDNIGLKFLFWMKITKNDLTMLLKFLSFLNAINVKNYINNNNNNNNYYYYYYYYYNIYTNKFCYLNQVHTI